jgi:hypothetical protein
LLKAVATATKIGPTFLANAAHSPQALQILTLKRMANGRSVGRRKEKKARF